MTTILLRRGEKQISSGDPNIIIGILDTGVDINHPDLRLVQGYDFGDNDNDPNDNSAYAEHGTCTAGIAAAIANNGIGVSGIAGGCSVMPIKVSSNGEISFTYAANALNLCCRPKCGCSQYEFWGLWYGNRFRSCR